MNRSSAWLKFGNLLGHKWCHPITKFNFVTFPLVRFPSFPQALAQKRFWGSFQGQNGDSMGCDHTSVSLARFMFISHQSWALKISFQEGLLLDKSLRSIKANYDFYNCDCQTLNVTREQYTGHLNALWTDCLLFLALMLTEHVLYIGSKWLSLQYRVIWMLQLFCVT